MDELSDIQNFYKGKTIFITGGSGLMGKVLVEKLLYSCSDLNKIYLLLRPKRGRSAELRINEMFKLPVSLNIEEIRKHFCKITNSSKEYIFFLSFTRCLIEFESKNQMS